MTCTWDFWYGVFIVACLTIGYTWVVWSSDKWAKRVGLKSNHKFNNKPQGGTNV